MPQSGGRIGDAWLSNHEAARTTKEVTVEIITAAHGDTTSNKKENSNSTSKQLATH